MNNPTRTCREIADDIRANWVGINPHANAHLVGLENVWEDRYRWESAESLARYFLSNASGWRGEKARELKAELKAKYSI